jgi:predicted ATPase
MSLAGVAPIHFGPFCLDRPNARLVRDGRAVALTPKALDLLAHLASRPDRLVTKEELLSTVWPDVIVSDASVKVCIGELRKALGDDPRSPRYIETVHRRGYRFLATSQCGQHAAATHRSVVTDGVVATVDPSKQSAPAIVGRDPELGILRDVLDRARKGERQIGFVTGEAGSGKTTLVEGLCRLARSPDSDPTWRIGIGHCFEQFGVGEAYMPVWEALVQLDRGNAMASPPPRPLLARWAAPSAHESPLERPGLRSTEPRAASDRVLRELVDTIEGGAVDSPLLMILEDLHWSDYSTLDLLSALARRKNLVRLALIGTFRPGDAIAAGHPLRTVAHELVTRESCREISLRPLGESQVCEYLHARMPPERVSDNLVRRIYRRTHGHPLFLASLVEDLIERNDAVDTGAGRGASAEDVASALPVPENVRAIIQGQLERLTNEEQRMLETAAVAGVGFSAAAVAAAVGEDIVRCEQVCADLARRHRFVLPDGEAEWPDGTLASRFRFIHELYHNVVYGRIPAARCANLHRSLAVRVQEAWSSRCDEIAAELAMHFERGRDWCSAVTYLRRCAARATDQYAHREAVDYLKRARGALPRLSDQDRERHELGILMSLAVHLQVTEGFAAPSVQEVHDRAYALCRDSTNTHAVFPVLWGIWLFKKVRSDLVEARELAEKLLTMAEQSRDTALLTQAHQAMSVTSLCCGEPLETCRQLRRIQLIYDPAAHALNTQSYGQDPGVACHAFGAITLWITGEVEEAKRISARSLELARQVQQPSSLALALHFSAMLHQCLGDAASTERQAREAAALAEWEGFSMWRAGADILHGWALAVQGNCAEGLPMIREGIRDWLATGSRTYHTYFLGLLVDALLRNGELGEALATVEDAIDVAAEIHEGLYLAELYWLKAKCHVRLACTGDAAQARAALDRSIAVAREQGAGSFEQRAAADLSAIAGARPARAPLRPRSRATRRMDRDRRTRGATIPSSHIRPS